MTRACRDVNKCGTTFSRPQLIQSCANPCSDGIQNYGELGIDCGGTCARTCPDTFQPPVIQPVVYRDFEIRTSEEDLKKSKITVSYNNKNAPRKSGVFFAIQLSDSLGRTVADEYLGPLTIGENEEFTKALSVHLYLLREGEQYSIKATVSEKGNKLRDFGTNVVLDEIPTSVFVMRILAALFVIAVLVALSAFMFFKYIKEVHEK